MRGRLVPGSGRPPSSSARTEPTEPCTTEPRSTAMPEDPKHTRLQELLQDRKSSTKGRASRRMSICLSAELSMDLEDAEQELANAKEAAANAEKTADRRAGGKLAVDPELAKQVAAATKAVEAAEAAVDAASVIITFTALKANEYDALLKEH